MTVSIHIRSLPATLPEPSYKDRRPGLLVPFPSQTWLAVRGQAFTHRAITVRQTASLDKAFDFIFHITMLLIIFKLRLENLLSQGIKASHPVM